MIAAIKHQVCYHPYRTALTIFLGQAVLGGALYSIFEPDASWYDGFYWSQVVMTTVGFGDFSPTTFPGRCVFTMTVIAGLFATFLFTAALASSITDARVNHPHEDTEQLTDDVDHAIVQAQEVLDALICMRRQAETYDRRFIKS